MYDPELTLKLKLETAHHLECEQLGNCVVPYISNYETDKLLKTVELRYFYQKWNLFLCQVLFLGASQEKPVRYFLVVCFTAATLMTLDLVSSGLRTFGGPAAVPSRATVIFKNQVEPTLAQLDLRAAKPDRANDVNSDVGIVLQPRLTQGI